MKTGFDEIRVTAQVAKTPATACAVLWDIDNHLEPGMKKRQVLTTKGNDRWTYERVSAPFNDRDYTLHRRKQSVEDGCHISFETQNDKGPAPQKGVIRIPVIRGEWRVEKGTGADDKTEAAQVVYTVYAEPGGVSPVFARGPEFDRSVQYAKVIVSRINTTGASASAHP